MMKNSRVYSAKSFSSLHKFMRKLFFCLVTIFLLGLSLSSVNAQNGWRGIIPLKTTKKQVEKTLGKPTNGVYELDEGRVHIGYVETQCDKILRCDCLVPQGTVNYIRIELYYDLYLKDIDIKNYKKTRDTHLTDIYSYSKPKIGIVYEVYDGKISHISYYESEKICRDIENANKKGLPKKRSSSPFQFIP